MADKEVIFEYNKMIIEHAGDLWKIAGALVVIQILMIAHVLSVKSQKARRTQIKLFLIASLACISLSFVCGYVTNAATINAFELYASGEPWVHSSVAEVFNLLQMASLTTGIAIFFVVFIGYSDILAEIMTKVGVKGGGD